MDLSIYGGTGTIGSYYHGLYGGDVIDRKTLAPSSSQVLYLISTTDNYNIYTDPTLDVSTNLLELTKRLDACNKAGVKEFNFISSWYVYGKDLHFFHEESVCYPNGFYPITKYAAERLVIDFCQTFNITWRILRLCNVYGKIDQFVSPKRNFLHWCLQNLDEEVPVILFKDVHRDYLPIFDLCRAINLVLTKGRKNIIYNVASGKERNLLDLVLTGKAFLESSSKVDTCDAPTSYRQHLRNRFSIERLRNLGFAPMIDMEEGLLDLCRVQKYCTPDRILTVPKFKQLFAP
jgi:dTDP-glucose 4,6-dehydratase